MTLLALPAPAPAPRPACPPKLLVTDSVQDIRYFVAERPEAYMYTSYYFEFDGTRCVAQSRHQRPRPARARSRVIGSDRE